MHSLRARIATGTEPLLFGIDQVLSSLSNAVLAFTVLASASAEDFGRFSMGLGVLGIAVGVVRSGILEWELLDDQRRTPVRMLLRRSTVVALAISILGMGVMAALRVVPVDIAVLFVAASLTSAGCDALRFAAFARGRPLEACLVDGTWLVGMLVSIAMLAGSGHLALGSALVAYSLSGVAGLLIGVGRADRDRPAQEGRRPLGLRRTLFGSDFLLNVISGYGVTLVLPAFFGLSLLGAFRGVITLFQPYTTLSYALRLWQLARLDWAGASPRTPVLAAAVQGAVGGLYAIPVLALYSTGVLDSVDSLSSVGLGALAIGACGEVARVVSQVAFDLARARDALGVAVGNRVVQLVLLVGGTVVLTHWTGIAGTLAARVLAYGVASCGVIACLGVSTRRRRHRPAGTS